MEIPDGSFWAAIGFFGASLFGYVVHNERTKLTRKEHSELHRRGEVPDNKIMQLKDSIDKWIDESRARHSSLGASMSKIKTDVAVIRTQMGVNDPLEDSGEYRGLG